MPHLAWRRIRARELARWSTGVYFLRLAARNGSWNRSSNVSTIRCLRKDQGCSRGDDVEVLLLSSWCDSKMLDATRGVQGVKSVARLQQKPQSKQLHCNSLQATGCEACRCLRCQISPGCPSPQRGSPMAWATQAPSATLPASSRRSDSQPNLYDRHALGHPVGLIAPSASPISELLGGAA